MTAEYFGGSDADAKLRAVVITAVQAFLEEESPMYMRVAASLVMLGD